MSPQENQPENKKWKAIMKWSGLGVEFAGVIFLFCFFGYKLDEKFTDQPMVSSCRFLCRFHRNDVHHNQGYS